MNNCYKRISILSPCSIGDTLYVPVFTSGSVVIDDNYKVVAFHVEGEMVSVVFAEMERDGNVYSRSFDFENYNKTFFTTREAAERFCASANQERESGRCPKDCLSCANSFYDDVNEQPVLRCMIKNGEIVEEDFYCEEYN